MAPHPYPNTIISNFCQYIQNKKMRRGLIYTLIFIKTKKNILLGLKKRGLGAGKWNGFGGKVEKNETLFEGAIRETKEESNLCIENVKHIGVVVYEEINCSTIDVVHIFTTNKYTGILQESEEMDPKWFNIKNIPYHIMWPDAKFWYPKMLENKYFFSHVVYEDENSYVSTQVEEFEDLKSVLESLKSIEEKLGENNVSK